VIIRGRLIAPRRPSDRHGVHHPVLRLPREALVSLDLTVRCGCSRTMRLDAAAGRGHMVCGCGNRIHVDVPNRMVFEHGMCCWVGQDHGCTGQAIDPKVQLCETHLRAVVDWAAAHRLRLAKSQMQRQQLSRLAADVAATPEQQDRLNRDQFARNVRAQRDKIHRAIGVAGEVVYYVRLGPDRLKVGVSYDLSARLRAFRAPIDALLAAEPGDMALEKKRHSQFAKYRLERPGSREEYSPAPDLVAWIDQVRAEHGDPTDLVTRLRLAAVADMRESGPLLFGPNQSAYDDIEARLRRARAAS